MEAGLFVPVLRGAWQKRSTLELVRSFVIKKHEKKITGMNPRASPGP